MTAVTPDNVWSLSVDTAARLEGPLRAAAGLRDPRVDETVALPRCSLYRKAFRGAAVGYPAEVLRWDAAARWIARRGVTVDVDCAEGLDIALSAGVDPVRIVMHRSDCTAGPVRRAVNAGVGRFVVSSSKQIALLDHCGQRPQRVLIDVSAGPADAAAADIAARDRLNLIGLHCRLDDRDAGTDVVRAMIAQMSWVVRRHGVILARVSLADFETADWGCESGDLCGIAEAINDAVEDGCARHRFPRPALALSPSAAAFSATGSGSWAGRLFRNRSDA